MDTFYHPHRLWMDTFYHPRIVVPSPTPHLVLSPTQRGFFPLCDNDLRTLNTRARLNFPNSQISLTNAGQARGVGENHPSRPRKRGKPRPKGYALTDQLTLIGSPTTREQPLLLAPAVDKPPAHRTEPVDGPYGVRGLPTAPRQ